MYEFLNIYVYYAKAVFCLNMLEQNVKLQKDNFKKS